MKKNQIIVTIAGIVLAAGCVVSTVFAVKANGELSTLQGQIDTLTASNASLSSEIEAANSRIEQLENALPGVEVQALMASAFDHYNKTEDMVKTFEITSKTDVAGLAIEVSDEHVTEEIQYMREHCPEGKYLPEDLEQIYITEREHLEQTLIQSVREELLKVKQGLIEAEKKAADEAAKKKAEEEAAKKKAEQQSQPSGDTGSSDSGNGGNAGYEDSGSAGGNDDGYSGGGSGSQDWSGGSDSGSGGSNNYGLYDDIEIAEDETSGIYVDTGD